MNENTSPPRKRGENTWAVERRMHLRLPRLRVGLVVRVPRIEALVHRAIALPLVYASGW
jgi:hypothetical protein